jgi:hypothetical protein
VSRPRRSRLAEQVESGRELVVLTDGPWRGRWYWADDLAAGQDAARRYPPEDAAGQLQSYHPSTDRVRHPDEPDITGTAYLYQQPAEELDVRAAAPRVTRAVPVSQPPTDRSSRGRKGVGVQQRRAVALPPGTRSVARPSRFGNPFRCAPTPAARAEAVARYRDWLTRRPALIELGRRELAGYDLACYCPLDGPCHRDVWLALLGEPEIGGNSTS